MSTQTPKSIQNKPHRKLKEEGKWTPLFVFPQSQISFPQGNIQRPPVNEQSYFSSANFSTKALSFLGVWIKRCKHLKKPVTEK